MAFKAHWSGVPILLPHSKLTVMENVLMSAFV